MIDGQQTALNPALYNALKEIFGSVIIARQGDELISWPTNSRASSSRLSIASAGEYYRVSCPFCSDTRHRLWINHRWGVGPDNATNDKMWWACFCYNCEFGDAGRQRLRSMVYMPGRFRRKIIIHPGNADSGELREVEDPGTCVPINKLDAQHRAAEYMRYRGFDLDILSRDYAVKYCSNALPAYGTAQDRIVFPIYMANKYVGWQARFVGDIAWKQAGIPKYYNICGVPRRKWVYGVDLAAAFNFCIIVEGVTDAIAIGPPAIAILGKSLSMPQFQEISCKWQQVIIALDDDAYDASEMLFDMFKRGKVRVARVAMPTNTDPADVLRQNAEHFWDLVVGAARQADMRLGQRCT